MVTGKLVSSVSNYTLEGAFVSGPVNNSNIISETLFNNELVLVTSKKYNALEQMPHKTALVFNQGCSFRTRLEHWLHQNVIFPYEVSEIESLEGIIGCVAGGIGFSMLPKHMILKSPYTGRLKIHPVSSTLSTLPTVFIQRKNTKRTTAMATFLHALKETVE